MSDDRKRRFARFYYDDFLREYPEVYADDAALAAWVRLLVVAEQTWPNSPELPRAVKGRGLRVLVGAGLVALGPRFTFALRGHEKERSHRHGIAIAAANASATARAHAGANAPANAEPRRVEQSRAEVSPPPQVGKRANGTNPRALGANPRANGTSPRQEREGQKRAPTRLHEILTSIQKGDAS